MWVVYLGLSPKDVSNVGPDGGEEGTVTKGDADDLRRGAVSYTHLTLPTILLV